MTPTLRKPVGALAIIGLIIVGIFYAFYIKPTIIRRMKNKALAKAKSQYGFSGSARVR